MSNMHELTHPVELRDEELDLVAAGSLIEVDVSDNNVAALNNINAFSAFTGPQTVKQS
jgi:hypothetical protein